ncbi:lytic murein transglycosylase B [Methylophaga sp. 42_25_T18]|mgnify:CR=1 FL=1|nr:lytic murein transglycosylase B [Methylophaga sp. 42_25_T18]OUR89774.1 lytic murein transglycosylase B [Methylophaga sp. 42_8_T64]
MKQLIIVATLMCISMTNVYANPALPDITVFIDEMVTKHDFDKDVLSQIFNEVEVKDSILKAISRPAEKSKPWYDYRKIFITEKRINGGVKFWKNHTATLAAAEQKYGVPAEIIIAILGVETRYGGNVGGYRVVDALSTLAFRYPPRSPFFRSELEHFLLLTREENMSRLTPVGSYAGAMGLGQFMPSSYREYAVDFDNDGKRDIWTNPVDAIGSIANYLKRHGWVAGKSIVHKTFISGETPTVLLKKGLKPSINRAELTIAGISLHHLPMGNDDVSLISLTQTSGEEYWLARQNFYAVTRYNHSRMYAMAVTQLAQAIREQYGK